MDGEFFDEEKRPHLQRIAEVLMMVKDGRFRRVSISMCPRAGKSYIVSMYCAWMLGLFPTGSIMRNSYAEKLAQKFSYDVRDIVKSVKYTDIFPTAKLSPDKQSVNGWNLSTSKQVGYFCAGVGGGITGFGCDLLSILDDPIKNFEDAMSEVTLEKTWNWYTSTHKTRQENCPEIHIATRWSNKDIIGRLMDEGYFDYSIEIPALNDRNESYCEANITTADLLEIKAISGESIFECIYQQNPIEIKGLLFPINRLNRFAMSELHGTPDGIIGACDVADEGNDYLASGIGQMFDKKIFVTDVIFNQDRTELTKPLVAQQIINARCDRFKFESNSMGKEYGIQVKELVHQEISTTIKWEASHGNKDTRILMKSGYVLEYFYFRNDYAPGSDYDKFMRNLTGYVRGAKNLHDDAPDMIAMLAEQAQKNVNFITWG
jgi:predicted phage terminase large subunit-like protein